MAPSTFPTMGHGLILGYVRELFFDVFLFESNSHTHHPVISVANNILVYFLSALLYVFFIK